MRKEVSFADDNDEVFARALANGCDPVWPRSMFGKMCWHCTCDDNRHGLDQQCSLITLVTAQRKPEMPPAVHRWGLAWIFVLAGSLTQYRHYCFVHCLRGKDVRYINNPYDLQGYNKGLLVRYGTWYTRSDAHKITDTARACGLEIMDDNS